MDTTMNHLNKIHNKRKNLNMMMQNLIDRLRAVVESHTESHRRFKELEEKTGLKAASWQNFWNGRQRPTWEMIELASKAWPQYAFWISTGIHDEEHGHLWVDSTGKSRAQCRYAEEYFVQKLRSTVAEQKFKCAMARSSVVREDAKGIASGLRFVFLPEDGPVLEEKARAFERVRNAFLAREEDAVFVKSTLERDLLRAGAEQKI
jgi:transcriptional regulator with XRE-family HTH domain